jgi:hypothetical protein
VTNELKILIENLKEEAWDRHFKLSSREIKSDGIVIVSNVLKKKACFIVGNNDSDVLLSYVIHIKKFLWAEEEGFTRGDMVSKLGDEVFESIPLGKIIDHLK